MNEASAGSTTDLTTAAATPEAALALFDRLPPVQPGEVLGRWCGGGFATGHPLDGLLETYHWYGKDFHTLDDVDPLLFRTAAGSVVPLRASLLPDPGWIERWPWLRTASAGRLFQRLALPLWITDAPQARLRVVEFRGVASAAMLYDRLPIIDVFRRLEADTLLGLMDARGIPQPFFFTLRREMPAMDPPQALQARSG